VAKTVLDAVLDNPAWVSERMAGSEQPPLRLALNAVLASLAKQDAAHINVDTGIHILEAALAAAAARRDLLDTLPASGSTPAMIALTAALDSILGTLLDPSGDQSIAWGTTRASIVALIVDVALDRLGRHGAAAPQLAVLQAQMAQIARGALAPAELAAKLDETLPA
jgi:hypothetical protein